MSNTDTKDAPALFAHNNLPPVIPGTSGWIMPNDEEVMMCRVPEDGPVEKPPHWQDPEPDQAEVGMAHTCIDSKTSDAYINREFDDFFTPGEKVDPNTDDRAKLLHDYWAERGHDVEVFKAVKDKPALVVGISAVDGMIQTTESKQADLSMGDLVLMSPVRKEVVWNLKPNNVIKRYDNEGIRQGKPPSQLLPKKQ